jgi:hypothetical protein
VCPRWSSLDGEPYADNVELHEAEYDVENGLVVKDKDGVRYRLRVTAERLP